MQIHLLENWNVQGMVLNSRDGMDEASIYTQTDIVEIKDNVKTEYTINPREYTISGKKYKQYQNKQS